MAAFFTEDQQAMLQAELDPGRVKKRSESGRSLSYLEGYDIIDTCNRIFGFGMWERGPVEILKYTEQTVQRDGRDRYDVHVVVSSGLIVHGQNGQSRAHHDVGYGNGNSYTGFAESMELAYKEATTDSMKRCLRHYGNQFGNSLYDKDWGRNTPQRASGNQSQKGLQGQQPPAALPSSPPQQPTTPPQAPPPPAQFSPPGQASSSVSEGANTRPAPASPAPAHDPAGRPKLGDITAAATRARRSLVELQLYCASVHGLKTLKDIRDAKTFTAILQWSGHPGSGERVTGEVESWLAAQMVKAGMTDEEIDQLGESVGYEIFNETDKTLTWFRAAQMYEVLLQRQGRQMAAGGVR